jgi:beta-lactam-binding protein with PASTA domain
MPDLVGSNLQEAQDAIQALTGYGIAVTTSSDATQQGRQQVLDRNWRVCAQSVAPGEAIAAGSRIDFAAVKLDESC